MDRDVAYEGAAEATRRNKWSRNRHKRANPIRWLWSLMMRALLQIHAITSAFKLAAVFTLLTAFIGLVGFDKTKEIMMPRGTQAYTVMSSFISILVVFHSVQCYNRFMSGITLAYQMYSEFCDAATCLAAFVKVSKAAKSAKEDFLNTMARLFSMLFMSCLAELELRPEEELAQDEQKGLKAHRFELLDPQGLDADLLHQLREVDNMPLILNHKIMHLMMQGAADGVLDAPPPIVSRAFQELGLGMARYHECCKFKDVPFPQAFITLVDILLVVHSLLTPFVSIQWSHTIGEATVYTFFICFFTWSLHIIAEELETPFGDKELDMDAKGLTDFFNRDLLSLVHDARDPILPKSAPNALNLQVKVKKGERLPPSQTSTFGDLAKMLRDQLSLLSPTSSHQVQLSHTSPTSSRQVHRDPSVCATGQARSVLEGEDVEAGMNAASHQPSPNHAAVCAGEHTPGSCTAFVEPIALASKSRHSFVEPIALASRSSKGQHHAEDAMHLARGGVAANHVEPELPVPIGNTAQLANHMTQEYACSAASEGQKASAASAKASGKSVCLF